MDLDGVLVVDKPPGPTSHDVVARVRKLTGMKVGHTGTLDPATSGVLPLVLGRATRLSRFFQPDKEYIAGIRLGRTTDTYDTEGQVLEERPVPEISETAARELLARFVGTVKQLPPMFSAVKVGGERLYKAARRREERERPLREVTIHSIDVLELRSEYWLVKVHCSSGTYIRTLAHDLGREVGCGALLEDLRRTRSGEFGLTQALSMDEVATGWREAVIPIDDLLPEIPSIQLDQASSERVRHGNTIVFSGVQSDGPHRLTYQGRLLAIGQVKGDVIRPSVVLSSR
jgi:tRNA pseudouridine55 synthase